MPQNYGLAGGALEDPPPRPQPAPASRCDACGTVEVAAVRRFARGTGRLALCGHHSRQHELALMAGGWEEE